MFIVLFIMLSPFPTPLSQPETCHADPKFFLTCTVSKSQTSGEGGQIDLLSVPLDRKTRGKKEDFVVFHPRTGIIIQVPFHCHRSNIGPRYIDLSCSCRGFKCRWLPSFCAVDQSQLGDVGGRWVGLPGTADV